MGRGCVRFKARWRLGRIEGSPTIAGHQSVREACPGPACRITRLCGPSKSLLFDSSVLAAIGSALCFFDEKLKRRRRGSVATVLPICLRQGDHPTFTAGVAAAVPLDEAAGAGRSLAGAWIKFDKLDADGVLFSPSDQALPFQAAVVGQKQHKIGRYLFDGRNVQPGSPR